MFAFCGSLLHFYRPPNDSETGSVRAVDVVLQSHDSFQQGLFEVLGFEFEVPLTE